MQSMISLMSMNHSDIAPLDDLEEIPDLESSGDISEHVFDITQQLEQLTSSLNSPEALTPNSVPSIGEDPKSVIFVSNHVSSLSDPTPTRALDAVSEIGRDPRPIDTSDKTDATLAQEELESLAKQDREKLKKKLANGEPGSLFHTFNFKDDKPAPLASPEQDKLSDKDQESQKLVYKPPEVKKRIDLLPLNLMKSYDFDAGKELNKSELNKQKTGTLGRDKTPGQDLLEWCKDVTKDYDNVNVTNLTTSFKNGMAFAAIIAHHRPDLM